MRSEVAEARRERPVSGWLWFASAPIAVIVFLALTLKLENKQTATLGDNFTLIAATLAFITMLLVVAQIQLAYRELRIVERQDRLLSREAVLSLGYGDDNDYEPLLFDNEQDDPHLYRLWFYVRNSGDRSSGEFYLTFRYPHDSNSVIVDDPVFDAPGFYEADGGTGRYLQQATRLFREPVFPQRSLRISVLVRTSTIQQKKLEWQIISEDGVFPGPGQFGSLDVDFS